MADNREKQGGAAGRASRDMGDGFAAGDASLEHVDASPAPAEEARPALSHRDYAVFAAQTSEQILRDCVVDVFRATGPGGQGVNTTDSAVRMRHVPTGVVVVCRESRSQLQNRQACLAKLRAVFERRSRVPKPRKKTKVSRAQKERRLQAKHRAGQKKSLRARVDRSEFE